MGSTLKFTVEVAADQATQALNAISTAVNQTGVQMRTSLLGVRPAAQAAGKEISRLSEHIRGFAAETAAQQVKALTDAIAVNDAVAQEAQKKEQEKLADNAIKRIKEEEKRKAEARQKAAKEEALRVAKSGDQAVLSRLKEGQDYDQSEAEGNALIEKQRAERLAKAQKEYNDELADSIALAQRWGSALGNVFAQLAAGQMSASDAIRAVMGEVIKSVIQSAITQITANAAVAGT